MPWISSAPVDEADQDRAELSALDQRQRNGDAGASVVYQCVDARAHATRLTERRIGWVRLLTGGRSASILQVLRSGRLSEPDRNTLR